MGDAAFRVPGRLLEVMPNGTFRADLKNGPRLTAFVAGRDEKDFAGLNPGAAVELQLTPYDLSVGRILVETKKTI